MNNQFVVGIGVHILCKDKKIREIVLTHKQATSLLNFLIHKQGGTLKLSAHTLEIYSSRRVSRDKEPDYISLAWQLCYRNPIYIEHHKYLEVVSHDYGKVATLQL